MRVFGALVALVVVVGKAVGLRSPLKMVLGDASSPKTLGRQADEAGRRTTPQTRAH